MRSGGVGAQPMAATVDFVGPAGLDQGKEAGVRHPQWREDVLLCIHVERLTAERLHHVAEEDKVDVGVAEDLAGCRLQRCGQSTMQAFVRIGRGEPPRILHVDVGSFS